MGIETIIISIYLPAVKFYDNHTVEPQDFIFWRLSSFIGKKCFDRTGPIGTKIFYQIFYIVSLRGSVLFREVSLYLLLHFVITTFKVFR